MMPTLSEPTLGSVPGKNSTRSFAGIPPDWDSPPQSDDQRAYSEDAIVRAAREFHNSTYNDYDWPSR